MLVIILAVVARSYDLYAKELAAAGNSANGGRVGALLQSHSDWHRRVPPLAGAGVH